MELSRGSVRWLGGVWNSVSAQRLGLEECRRTGDMVALKGTWKGRCKLFTCPHVLFHHPLHRQGPSFPYTLLSDGMLETLSPHLFYKQCRLRRGGLVSDSFRMSRTLWVIILTKNNDYGTEKQTSEPSFVPKNKWQRKEAWILMRGPVLTLSATYVHLSLGRILINM